MNLTIKKSIVIASIVLGIGFLTAVATNSLALSQLRVGGPVYSELKLDFDLLADVLPPPQYIIEPYLEATLAMEDPANAADHRARLTDLHTQYDERKTYWSQQPLDPDTRQLLDAAAVSAGTFWHEIDSVFIPALSRGDKEAAQRSYLTLSRAYGEHRDAINRLVAHGNTALEQTQKRSESATVFYVAITWIISLIVLGLLAAGIYGVAKLIVAPLLRFTDATKELAAGRLGTEIPALGRPDEMGELAGAMAAFRDHLKDAERAKTEQAEIIVGSIGKGLDHLAKGDLTHRITAALAGPFVKLKDDFNGAMTRLEDTVRRVLATTNEIATGAGEVSQAADDLSRRTEQQAASLEETAAALEEITATVAQTASNTKEVSTNVAKAKEVAGEGGRLVDVATKAMDSISQSSKQITDIIGVIDEIAFQTNLLALNAGVEAARAGDAGRGFAVVATEVRALAGRSSEAAKKIKALINTSGEQVDDGVRLVAQSGRALIDIVGQVQEINALIGQMACAAEQQSTGIRQVNVAVNQMDQMTQQNAAMVEQSTAASRKLAHETQALQEQVSFFQVARQTQAGTAHRNAA